MPQEPGSILAGCPRAAYGDAPALTPLSLQGEVGSPGLPGLPGPKVGASGDWDRLCAIIWGLHGAGEDPCAPQPGAAAGKAPYCISPFPVPRCREMLVCQVWMAALAWRASLDHR